VLSLLGAEETRLEEPCVEAPRVAIARVIEARVSEGKREARGGNTLVQEAGVKAIARVEQAHVKSVVDVRVEEARVMALP
jgi:hypothetical protein